MKMNIKAPEHFTSAQRYAFYETEENRKYYSYGTRGGWRKYEGNPVLGGKYGTCFDMSIIKEFGKFKMWFSWRDHKSIGYCESKDGINWNEPIIVLGPVEGSTWEADEINRPSVIKVGDTYKMWYSGQMKPYREDGVSVLGYAESKDGIHWVRPIEAPVLIPDTPWEKKAIMCPHVIFEEEKKIYKLWYSAGCNHEPDAIGYATSEDGIHWIKGESNPILVKDPANVWEQHKVLACHVLKHKGWYYMFYIAHIHEERASICLARSKDGIEDWEKHPDNPLISPERLGWDSMSVYKPYVLRDNDRWILWYNGAEYEEAIWVFEQVGVAYLESEDFGF